MADLDAVLKSNKRLIIMGIGVIIVIIAAVIVLIAVLKPGSKSDMTQMQELLAAKNQTIQVLQDAQKTLGVIHQEVISSARAADERDSILYNRFLRNQINYQSINQKYERVPENNRRLRANPDSLLREIADY